MTRTEMLTFIDKQLEAVRIRGIAANGVTRTRMRDEFKAMTAIRNAIARHVPPDPVSPLQTEIDPFRPR